MIEQENSLQTLNDKSINYQSFTYESNEQRNKKKAQKKRLFLGIMILCIPLLFSFTYVMLNQVHKIHYPQFNEVSVNPYIYQHLNGTLAFIDTEGTIRVYDNRKNSLNLIGNYVLGQQNLKFLKNSWNNQLIVNDLDVLQVKWTQTNEVLNLIQIDELQYLDHSLLQDCNPAQSYPLVQDLYLLSCNHNLFVLDLKSLQKIVVFSDFNAEGVVLVKQSPLKNVFNIIFTSQSSTTKNEIVQIYRYDLRDQDTQTAPTLVYQGEHQIKPLKDVIIQTDYIILVFSTSVSNYKKIPPTVQGLEFELQLVDNQSVQLTQGSLQQCFEMKNQILICYDQKQNNLIQISEWSISSTLTLDQIRVISITQGQSNDLFLLTQQDLQRVTIQPISMSESYNFKKNGLNQEINDLIILQN